MLFTYGAVLLLPLAEATTLGFTAPVFAVLIAMVLLRERSALSLGRGCDGLCRSDRGDAALGGSMMA
jgi:hypothetical protein